MCIRDRVNLADKAVINLNVLPAGAVLIIAALMHHNFLDHFPQESGGQFFKGKERLNTSLNTLRPALAQYNQLAKDIRDKTKERRSLLSEKKALSAVHVFWHRELAAKIAALTEDLEELRSEKNLLLASLAYSEEDAADKFPKDIAAMEQSLKRLEEQEQKYSAELSCQAQPYKPLLSQRTYHSSYCLYQGRGYNFLRPSSHGPVSYTHLLSYRGQLRGGKRQA